MAAYGYRLWLRRPGHWFGDKAIAGASWYFDLADQEAMTGALDALIAEHGKGDLPRDRYRLEILDPATGETLRDIVPVEPALSAAPNGSGQALRLAEVSDEALARELLTRLTRRRV